MTQEGSLSANASQAWDGRPLDGVAERGPQEIVHTAQPLHVAPLTVGWAQHAVFLGGETSPCTDSFKELNSTWTNTRNYPSTIEDTRLIKPGSCQESPLLNPH